MEELPTAVRTYLSAHQGDDADTALATFTSDATVTDEGKTHTGLQEIRDWLQNAASEFTYTIELTGVRQDADRWIATHHLEGDFPGGVVDLEFTFTLRNGQIAQLVIEP